MNSNSNNLKNKAKAELPVTFGLMAVIFFFVSSGFISYWNTRILNNNTTQVMHTHEVITSLDALLSLVKDAETGQRGFVLTGDTKYLIPYDNAISRIDEKVADIESLTHDNPEQQARIPSIRNRVTAKLSELDETINLRKTKGFEEAKAVVVTDRGKNDMDSIRTQVGEMQDTERQLRNSRKTEMDGAYRVAIISGILATLLGAFLSVVVAALIRRSLAARLRTSWLEAGQVGLSKAILGEQSLAELGDNALKFLSEYTDAHAGAFFTKEGDIFKRVATYGILQTGGTPAKFTINDGLLGQAVKDGRSFVVHDVPEGYLKVGSALGNSNPRHLLISPSNTDGSVICVLELGFIHSLDERTLELFEQASDSLGIAVKAANYRAYLQNLLEETQRQSEELQAQGEELRVSNEELEEQSRALKESQSRLEQQQAELEQTNSQLEEQTQLLEGQKDDLERSKVLVQSKADELEKASQYKSDFLANMSHELRTPLNSSLILAKLLADNSSGNLTAEQIKFAETIQNSGNSLLSLINDILDLSKIEAGHMEIRPENIVLTSLTKDLSNVFEPIAKEKGLKLKISKGKNCPEAIDTDRQRLEQILKNLLSNAIKFTEKGSVELSIECTSNGNVDFTVKDTGIGIENTQQNAIFEAFRQADGTISRKYGGTGLGLSISRELTRLLGGTIKLESEASKGSIFTVTIPEAYDPSLVKQRSISFTPETTTSNVQEKKPKSIVRKTNRVEDDREKLTGNSRLILIIEDDESFARILYDLVHELEFECLIAGSAEEALALCQQYIPSAVVLDVGLPDNSGLSVLDRLKRDARTRHIPVHVVSAGDHEQKALSLGAIGYMFKPVKRDDLVNALKKLETKFAQRMRRVLIVEDDLVQQESVRKLLGSQDVQTIGAGTVAECLKLLKEQTFDCMVLDLSLPDASGYSLLETLSNEDAYSFPPVIVYTGHDLSVDDEQKLRRYSKSIIIKGAKSPERLLDEVTLFLHQVVSDLPVDKQRMLEVAKNRDAVLEGRRILIVEDDVANVYALTSILEPRGAKIQIARNGREAIEALEKSAKDNSKTIDLVLMDVMMPEVDGLTATREIRKNSEWRKLPIIMLTAKAMRDDQERCIDAGANDYMSKPLDVDKLLSLVRVWMPR